MHGGSFALLGSKGRSDHFCSLSWGAWFVFGAHESWCIFSLDLWIEVISGASHFAWQENWPDKTGEMLSGLHWGSVCSPRITMNLHCSLMSAANPQHYIYSTTLSLSSSSSSSASMKLQELGPYLQAAGKDRHCLSRGSKTAGQQLGRKHGNTWRLLHCLIMIDHVWSVQYSMTGSTKINMLLGFCTGWIRLPLHRVRPGSQQSLRDLFAGDKGWTAVLSEVRHWNNG